MSRVPEHIEESVSKAVSFFWQTRTRQSKAQKARGRSDQGSRTAVTAGHQMDGFVELLTELIISGGVNEKCIFRNKRLELPGYFRAEKKWDILVVREGQLIAAIEAKSQVGPSFGNNFNNRAEEAIGSALDLWTAYREGAFNGTVKPWLGYLFLLEDCPRSRSPVSVHEPHFKVFPDFVGASYTKRYEILCRRLLRERHYDAAAFLVSSSEAGRNGAYLEPAKDIAFEVFARSLVGHVSAFGTIEDG